MVATFGVSDGASDRRDRRHAAARRAHRHREPRSRRSSPRSRALEAGPDARSVHAERARAPAPRRRAGRHALRPDPRAHPAAVVGARRRAAHRSLAAPARKSSTRRTTSRRRAGCRRVVSVYDCSFVRYPELCTPEVRAFDPVVRRAIARGATVHTGSEFVADEIEEIFGPGLRAAGPAGRDPARRPALGDVAEMPRRRRDRRRRRAVRARDRHARAPQELRTSRRRVRRARGRPSRRSGSSSPATTARPGPRSTPRSRGCPPACATRVVLAGGVADAGRRALLENATRARVPVDLRRLRLPGARGDDRGRARRRGARRVDPRGRGRRRAARSSRPTSTALADAIDRVLTDDAIRAELIARGRDRVHAFSWDHTARALASCYRARIAEPARHSEGRGARRSAAPARPGRHRPLRDRPAAPSPRSASSPIAFAAGAPAPRASRRAFPGSTSGAPHGSVRYELWHRLHRPGVRDRGRRRARAEPRGSAGARRPLVVTVHDIAFLRLPHVTTQRGVSFHPRGLELARRHASLVIVPSPFTGSELVREGFERDRIAGRSVRRRSARATRSRRDRRDGRAAPACSRRTCSRSAPSSRARTSPTIVRAVERLRARPAPT